LNNNNLSERTGPIAMRLFISWIDRRFEEVASALMLAVLVLLLCMQVGLRFIFNMGLAWNEELERFVFVWFCYLSASFGVQKQGHIRVTTFVNLIPQGFWRQLVIALSDLIWIIFNIFVVYYGIALMQKMIQFEHLSPALRINMVFLYAIIPGAFALMSFRLLQLYWRRLQQWREGQSTISPK
jgi:TRAP-type C4-dicarboxylate transport system permease small subunit